LISLALPREAHEARKINNLGQGLGGNLPIDVQDVSEPIPKPVLSAAAEKPDVIVDRRDSGSAWARKQEFSPPHVRPPTPEDGIVSVKLSILEAPKWTICGGY
jgi:hypothetical protein